MHSREAIGTVTPFDKYAESKSRSDCCAVTVAKRLLPNFVKYAEAQSLVRNIYTCILVLSLVPLGVFS